MHSQPVPVFPSAADRLALRRRDLVERLEWVIHRQLDELPDTLVAGLHALGVACERTSAPRELIARLGADHPEIRAAS